MKRFIQLFTVIAAAVIISFSFTACPESDPGNDPNTPSEPSPITENILNGLWWYPELMTELNDTQGTPGMWMIDYPNFWRLNGWGVAVKGSFTIDGKMYPDGEASGSFTVTTSGRKDSNSGWKWTDSVVAEDPREWNLSGSGSTAELVIGGLYGFQKADISFIGQPSEPHRGPWITKIGDAELDTLVTSLLPSTPIGDTTIDGLWWNEAAIKNGEGGDPGVWVFMYPYFWNLNNSGEANKGTITLEGEISAAGLATGSFTATTTDNGTAGNWTIVASPTVQNKDIELSIDKTTLTIGTTVFTKTSWYATVNSADNNGPWQDKIDDPLLTDQIPERFGWNGTTFNLPPFITQPSTSSIIEYNNESMTRDLFKPFINETTPLAAKWGPADGNGAEARLINIQSHGAASTRLALRVLRTAQYLVFELGPGFTSFNKEFCLQWYSSGDIRGSSTSWYYPLSPNIASGSPSNYGESYGLANGLYWDATNRYMIIDFEKAMPEYAAFAGANTGSLKPDNPAYDINTGTIIINLGFRANMGVFRDDWDVKNVYLVNIVE